LENGEELVDKYLSEIQELGVVVFQTQKPTEGSNGGRPERYCLLNEAQSNFVMTLSRNSDQVVRCKLSLTQAFERAKSVIKTVIPAMSEEIQKLQLQNENMKLELEVHKERQRTLSAAGLMALTAPALVEAIMLPGVTVIAKAEYIDRTVVVDKNNRVLSQLDGIGITSLQKQFGFKSTKAAWEWLESIGYGKHSGHWQEEMTAHTTPKLDRSVMQELKEKFAAHHGDRQKLLGE
jgi:anti-repressor protein